MASVLQRSVLLFQRQQQFQNCCCPIIGSSLVFSRGLKRELLYKKQKKKKPKLRDGKVRTVDQLHWELYFKDNPHILQERELANLKQSSVKSTWAKPLSPRRVYETLTTSDKRLAFAAVFALVTGFIAIKITFA